MVPADLPGSTRRRWEDTQRRSTRSYRTAERSDRGVSRGSKSTLLRELFAKSHRYVSFDDPVTRERARSDPNLFLDGCGDRVVFDEIQYVPEITTYLKIRIDAERKMKGRHLLTSSQRFTLIRNLGDSLAGRVALFDLFPFSATEILSVPRLRKSLATAESLFVFACMHSMYPEPALTNMDVAVWYGAYLQTYLERDVRSIYDIGSLRDFQLFIQLLASRCAQVLNMSSLSQELGIGVNTVRRWLSILEASRIIYLLPPYYNNMGKRITKAPRLYFLDIGLVCHLVGLRSREHLLHGPMAGALFETQPLTVHLIEIKLSKTLTPAMGSSIEKFRKLFANLSVQAGRVVSLHEDDVPLSRGVVAQGFGLYLEWVKTMTM